MQYGVCIPHYGKRLEGPAVRDIAQAAEGLGYETIWATDHLVIPTDVDIVYRDEMLEPLSVLMYVAAVTQRVRLGTSVLILPYRNPILVAKMVATLDVLSGGRAILGAAVGWIEGEFAALSAPFKERGRYSDEALRIIVELWTSESPSFQGRYYQFSDIAFSPRPVQRPHPPIWIGGNSPAALRRAAEFGDAWHASSARPEEAEELATRLRRISAERGRKEPPTPTARVSVALAGIDGGPMGRGPATLTGTVEEVAAAMQRYVHAGFTHLALFFGAGGVATTLKAMERFAREVVPQVQAGSL